MADINKNTVLRWIIYIGAFLVSLYVYLDVSNNFKFPILGVMFCPGFGGTNRCDEIIIMSIISMVNSVACFVLGLVTTINERNAIHFASKLEVGLSISQFGVWVMTFWYMVSWTLQTGGKGWEFRVLFLSIIILICLFYMATLISFAEMAYRESLED